jgi:predicted HTH domain antitoxin
MKLELNEEVMSRVNLPEQKIKEILAVSLYQLGKINGVQGGKLIGTSEIQFHEVLGELGQVFSYDENDLLDDMDTLKKL